MTKEQLKRMLLIQTILETIEQSDSGYIPQGHCYMAMSSMVNLDQFDTLLDLLRNCKAIETTRETISKGIMFDKILSAMKRVETKLKEQRIIS